MAKEQDEKDGAAALANMQSETFLMYHQPFQRLLTLSKNENAITITTLYHQSLYSFLFLTENDKPPRFLS